MFKRNMLHMTSEMVESGVRPGVGGWSDKSYLEQTCIYRTWSNNTRKRNIAIACRQNQTKIPKIIAFIVFQLMYDTVDQFQEVRSTCCYRSKVFLSTVFMAKATNIALQLQSLTKYGKKTKWCKKKRAVNYLCLTSCRHQPPKSFKGKKSKPICWANML